VKFLVITLPASILLAAVFLFLVVRAARRGEFDDWEGPAWRHSFDDDSTPERESEDAP
jgi:cbb3-type cytochrome oxidase maturation protein